MDIDFAFHLWSCRCSELNKFGENLAITIKENIDIKIKTTELDQVKNYEKVGVLGVLPIIKVNGAASGNTGSSSIEFATEDFPEINDADSESKSINGNVEISYSLFGGLSISIYISKIKKTK